MAEIFEAPNQREWWDGKHVRNNYPDRQEVATEFGRQVVERFPLHSTVLELGCGAGDDAAHFAERGHRVVATDFSPTVIERNKRLEHAAGVLFEQLDIANELQQVDSESFDVVYSHLALHYFDDETTREIFAQLHRVLKPGGILVFACKSTNDMRYGKGEQIGPDIFIDKGHIRHFFSEEYARELLETYHISQLQEVQQRYAGDDSHMLHCVAVKEVQT